MDTNVRFSPRDFFLHLGIIVALYVSIVSLISLLFHVIDYALGDNLNYMYDFYSSNLRVAMAALIVFFPVYLILGWFFQRDLSLNPEKQKLAIRRWLVYLTLFAAGLTIVIDLVVLLNSFLGGEITTSFAFKVLAVLVVAGLTFAYYILDLRNAGDNRRSLYTVFASAAAVIVIASIVGAFAVVGSPVTQREKRFDTMRVNHLEQLSSMVMRHWQINNQKLPQNLADLNSGNEPAFALEKDPVTREEYEYRPLNAKSFELCATFARSNKEDIERMRERNSYPYNFREWVHGKGRTCFTRTINPAEFPSLLKPRIIEDM